MREWVLSSHCLAHEARQEVGIYKRKQASTKTRTQPRKRSIKQRKTRTRPRKRSRKQELNQESDKKRKYFLFFLITFLVEFLFSCFLTFLFSFINSHLRPTNFHHHVKSNAYYCVQGKNGRGGRGGGICVTVNPYSLLPYHYIYLISADRAKISGHPVSKFLHLGPDFVIQISAGCKESYPDGTGFHSKLRQSYN